MGQQQLLLLIVAVVLVGLAVVAGLQVMEKHYRQDEADGLLDRSLAIATHAVSWKTRNDAFAGGNQSYEELEEGGLQLLALDSANVRGRFAITGATVNTLEVTAVSTRFPEVAVRVSVTGYDINDSDLFFDGSITLP